METPKTGHSMMSCWALTGHGPAPQWPLGSAPNLHDLVRAQHSATWPSCWKWLEARAWEMGLSKVMGGTTIFGWFTRGNPMKIGDLGVPLFQETSKWRQLTVADQGISSAKMVIYLGPTWRSKQHGGCNKSIGPEEDSTPKLATYQSLNPLPARHSWAPE